MLGRKGQRIEEGPLTWEFVALNVS
jgi:hypothetical protein